jgi:hypothetical protein
MRDSNDDTVTAVSGSSRQAGLLNRGRLAGCVLACVMTMAAPAAAQTAPAEPTAEQVKAFLKHQGDPVVGAWVERQLQQGNGAAIAAAAAPDPAAGDRAGRGGRLP